MPDDAKLSSITFPWILAVSKVDDIGDRIRWRLIISKMPLSLLIITVGVNQKVPTSTAYINYYCYGCLLLC